MFRTEESRLPPAFADLESLVDEGWCFGNWVERNERRYASTMAELRSFYDRLMVRAEDALSYLSKTDVDNLDSDDLRLLQLMLMLAEVSFPVERHGQPNTPSGIDTNRFLPWNPRTPETVP